MLEIRTLFRHLAGPRSPLPSGRLIACRRCGLDVVKPIDWDERGRDLVQGMRGDPAAPRRLDPEAIRSDASATVLRRALLVPDDYCR